GGGAVRGAGRIISIVALALLVADFFTLANRGFVEQAALNRAADVFAVLCLLALTVGVVLMAAGKGGEALPAEPSAGPGREAAGPPDLRRVKLLLAIIALVWLVLVFPWLALSRVGVLDGRSFSSLGSAVGSIVIGGMVMIQQYLLPPLGLLAVPLLICAVYLLLSRKTRPVLDVLAIAVAILAFSGLFYLNLKMDGAAARQEQRLPEEAVSLSFPLRDGRYLVVQSGPGPNVHTTELERYALDIVRSGNWFSLFGAGRNSDPALDITFGTPVYSPCRGSVRQVRRDVPDQPIGVRDTVNKNGNFVVIAGDDCHVLLAHLKRDSIVVKEGEKVQAGQYLGMIGNSGNTDGPHLHIMAFRGDPQKQTAIPLPMVFEGRFLGKGDTWP
ncbi:MAG: M23 family metallopeptidase, partial [Syntrophomonadaceae bacterium]|nr:M23 family metallopeptidase [Syntrophomonadaceae bacterium]